MKKVRCYLTAAVLTFTLAAAAYAGQMDTTPAPQDSTGQMDTTPSADASGSAVTVETLAEIALDIYQTVNP